MSKEKLIALIDLECTCDESDRYKKITSKIPRDEMEIIEIGCSIINEKGELKNTFTIFVKPLIHKELTDFCKTLTHIKQENVDNGLTLAEGLKELDKFLISNNAKGWSSWGYFDKNKIISETTLKNIDISKSFLNSLPHSNLSLIVKNYRNINKKCGVRKTMNALGLTFQGEQHRAIYDTINMAKIVEKINEKDIVIKL